MTFLKCIDVSVVQTNTINWQRVRAAGVTHAYLKATEGLARSADPTYRGNAIRTKDAGVTRGAYHFCKVDLSPGMRSVEDDARGEVQRFASFCDLLGSGVDELPPALDFEALRGQSAERASEWLMHAIDETTKLWGRSPVIYTGRYSAEGIALEPVLAMVPEIAGLQLWRSGYPLRGAKPNQRAITWTEAEAQASKGLAPLRPWYDWWVWQFSGGGLGVPGNRVDGVPGLVDCNLMRV